MASVCVEAQHVPRVEISGVLGRMVVKVDGLPLEGVRSLVLDVRPDSLPVLKLEIIASRIDVDLHAIIKEPKECLGCEAKLSPELVERRGGICEKCYRLGGGA